jgi:hypothetical protein
MRVQLSGIELDLSAKFSTTVLGIPQNPDDVSTKYSLFKVKVKRYSLGKYVTYRLFEYHIPDTSVVALDGLQLLNALAKFIIDALCYLNTGGLNEFALVLGYDVHELSTLSIWKIAEKRLEKLSMLGMGVEGVLLGVLHDIEQIMKV